MTKQQLDFKTTLSSSQMVAMIRLLLPGRARIAVISYKDYSDGDEVCTYVPLGSTPKSIVAFVQALYASGGGDAPEATKTGLNKIADMIRANEDRRSKSFVIHYTDAPPHCEDSQSQESNKRDETKALRAKDPGYDWARICRYFGSRNIPVYTFLTADSHGLTKSLMLHLGRVVLMRDKSSYNVTKATIGMLMHVLGQEFEYDADFTMLGCNIRSKTFMGFRREGWGDPGGKGDGAGCQGAAGGAVPKRMAIDEHVPHLDLTLNSHVKDETRKGGFHPYSALHPHLSEKVPFHFPPIGIRLNVDEILNQFSTDIAFQNTVFEVLAELFTPECCLSMTYNPILGKLWRLVCKMRGDDRLQTLRTKLSDAIGGVRDPRKQKQIKDWLDASYNAEEEIADLMLNVKSYDEGRNENVPCLILDPAKALGADPATVKEALRSLARAPTRAGLALAQDLMTSLILIDDSSFELPISPNSRNGVVVPLYLPLSLRPKLLFGCLPHLASPGMMFSLRPAIMISIMAFLSGNKHLVEKAEAFLVANRGQWINLNDVTKIPEVLSEETVKLLRRVPQFLTDEENVVYAKLFLVSRLRLAFRKEFLVKLPLSPNLKSVFADYRFPCGSCQFYRSFTLMTPDGRCGLCVFNADNPDFSVVPSDVDEPTSRSRIVCCRTCRGIYEVVKHQDLNVEPKCHFCRAGQTSPSVTCGNCSNRYVLPDPSLLEKMGQNEGAKWICAICATTPHLSFEQVPFLLRDILYSNLHLMDIFNLVEATFDVIDGKNSFFKIFTELWAAMEETPLGKEEAAPVMLKRRKAFNVEELKGEIKKVVDEGDMMDMCFLCCEEKLISQLATSPCGHCNNKICFDCQRQWVNQIQPGKVVLPSNLVCPFCKTVPKESVYTKYNRPAKSLLHKEHLKRVIQRMDPSLYYGWCKGCSKIQEIGPVACGGAADVPYSTSDDFVCETCTIAMQSAPNVPKCPGCGAPTVKAYGCNHIHCPQCSTHWCYVCHEKFDPSVIYDHLSEVHGGIGL